MHSTTHHEYLASCCDISRDAGKLIMTYFRQDFDTRKKEDKSPVTDADVILGKYFAALTLIVILLFATLA